MPSKTVSFKTFGCKQNQYDTDFLRESFKLRGFQVVDEGPSDVVVVNTCAVTAKGAAKCRQAIRSAARGGAKVVVTGCYSQIAPNEVDDIPGVIAVTGVRGRSELAALVDQALTTGEKVVEVAPHDEPGTTSEAFEETPVETPRLTRAFLKIQEGCGDFCAYCVVPYARGPSRSRPVDRILAEAEGLVQKGYKEIVLTGTHIGLYGKDEPRAGGGIRGGTSGSIGGCPSLPHVVRQVSEVPGLIRLRISSLEPHDVDDDLLDCLRLPQVCAHLHLPLQSGSDRILRLMGRRYDVSSFLDVVDRTRRIAPGAGVTTDVIVGFPGETDGDFDDTLNVAKQAGFSRIHAFKFSARPSTRAWDFAGKVGEKEKDERVNRLIDAGLELSHAFHRKHVGRVMEVLAEDDRTKGGLLTGVTRNYIRCNFAGGDEHKGRIVPVFVREARESSVTGDIA
ncbi:MAG: tRNA (N(6)-L-threonylcarbamoyladenosine(37)-C(2))-methylthiotransferase MtaB [Bacillota bacterium]